MSIGFLITTYNRQESCQRLVDSLYDRGDVLVMGDCVDYTIKNATFINTQVHFGKPSYWRLVNVLFLKRGSHKYYFMLPDDVLPTENMVERAIELWESIDDPQKICLNLIADRIGLPCWTNMTPRDGGNVWRTGWVDMCFMCENRFFTLLGSIRPIMYIWDKLPKQSSGVGAYISRFFHRKGFNFYQAKESLVILQQEHGKSQMNGQEEYPRPSKREHRKRYIKDTRKQNHQ